MKMRTTFWRASVKIVLLHKMEIDDETYDNHEEEEEDDDEEEEEEEENGGESEHETLLKQDEELKATEEHSLDTSWSQKTLSFAKNVMNSVKSWETLAREFYQPRDPSSLAFSRILFGFLMVLDIPEERGLSEADIRWGDPDECRFPLFDFLQPLPLHWMCMAYLVMWFGALGIALGAYFRISCLAFAIPYWYILLLDKTAWNNHSYLYGLLALLFLVSDAHHYWSIDAWKGRVKSNMDIPAINYSLFRLQLFFLYFHAGVKKTEFDWISGYSMMSLGNHWVFSPFRNFLSTEQIDLFIIHGCGFLLDFTVGFLVYFDYTRPASFIFLASFHFMNAQMFYIGMFPYVCLATMPLFSTEYWPKAILRGTAYKLNYLECSKLKFLVPPEDNEKNPACVYPDEKIEKVPWRKKLGILGFLTYAAFQAVFPYSHPLTSGYNNWTDGLYGYSWDMMVHTWDINFVTVKVVNHGNNETIFIDPEAWVRNNKWQRHADMVLQYSKCLKNHLETKENMKNFSIYFDVWVSLNKRFHQRMFDPHQDLLKAKWSPFERTKWLLPLLENFTHWRTYMLETEKDVRSWSDTADVVFMADFPGYKFHNYVHEDITNLTLTLLEGSISVNIDGGSTFNATPNYMVKLPSGCYHEIQTVSKTPSAFMYTFFNKTKVINDKKDGSTLSEHFFFDELNLKIDNFLNSIALVSNAFLRVMYNVPMMRRIQISNDIEEHVT